MPAVDISFIGAKGRHFELKIVLEHDDHAEMRADCVGMREKLLHGFRSRICDDVVILRH